MDLEDAFYGLIGVLGIVLCLTLIVLACAGWA